ncbi:hypothetical protein BDE02_13G047700 [Populus trichocarpa]|nr:hypothetical protein BDE02_13G047700 [Populus trichocarpa]
MRRKPTKKGCKIGENQAAIFGRISKPKYKPNRPPFWLRPSSLWLLHPTASTAAPFFLSSDPHTAVPTDPQLLPAPRKHFLLLLSAAVRLHQQPPATPGETHTCSSSFHSAPAPAPASTTTAAVSPHHSGAVSSSSPSGGSSNPQPGLSQPTPHFPPGQRTDRLHQRRLYKVTRQQATSPSPSTFPHRPAAPWSSDRPPEEETGSAVKQNRPLLAFYCVLQGLVFLTAGRKGKRRRKQGRSARFRHQRRRVASRAARNGGALEHALPAVPVSNSCAEGFLCNSWSFGGLICKFRII